MTNNTLTFSSPVQANLSWKIKLGEKELENVDSLVLNINNKDEIIEETDVRERTIQIDETSTFYISTQYGSYSARSGKLHVKIIGGGVYYGSVCASSSDIEQSGWEVVKDEIESWINSLDQNTLDYLTDDAPITNENLIIAHPGKLIKENVNDEFILNKKTYYFYCADDDVISSHPIIIYPKAYGPIKTIEASIGSVYDQSTSSDTNDIGFMMKEIKISGIDHYIYIQKTSNSTFYQDQNSLPLPYTFNMF